MKFPEPRTFWDATSPITMIRWALGIGIIEYPTGHQRRVMSLCWSGTYLIIFLYFIIIGALDNLWDLENPTFTKTHYKVFNGIATVCGIMLVYLGRVRSKNVVDSLYKLDGVNEMLNKFGIPKEYGLTFKYQVVHLIGTFVFMITMVVIPVKYTYNDLSVLVIGSIVSRQYVVLLSFLESYTFSVYVRYIGCRFRHLNAYLVKLSMKDGRATPFLEDSQDHVPALLPIIFENYVESRRIAVADQQWMMKILRNAKKIHTDLCNVAKDLNEAFGIQILLSMTMTIAVITSTLFNTYTLFLKSNATATDIRFKILVNVPWIGLYVVKVLCVISACSMASSEALQTGEDIQAFVKPPTSNELGEEIHAFSLQLMQNPLQFTAYGFFTLDHTMIRAMVGTVTTYLVIMIQTPDTIS